MHSKAQCIFYHEFFHELFLLLEESYKNQSSNIESVVSITKVVYSDHHIMKQGVRNPGGPGGPGPPQYFGKKCTQNSEKGDFEIFITLLGPPQ